MNADDFLPEGALKRHRERSTTAKPASEQVHEMRIDFRRMTVEELRKTLVDVPGETWVVLYDPQLDRRLWVQAAEDEGHFVLSGAWR